MCSVLVGIFLPLFLSATSHPPNMGKREPETSLTKKNCVFVTFPRCVEGRKRLLGCSGD